MKIPEVPEIPKHMLGLIVCSVVFTFIAVTYDESLVTYLLKQNVFNAYGFIFAFFAFAMYILTLLFTQTVVENIEDSENNVSENNENNENSEDSEEIDYSNVPTTPTKIEPPNTRRRLNESDEQIREFIQIPSKDDDDDNDDSDSSWIPGN